MKKMFQKVLKLLKKIYKKLKKHLTFYGFLFPALFCFFMVMIIPFFIGLVYSFTDWKGYPSALHLIGLQNYATIFGLGPNGVTSDTKSFVYSVIITVLYTVFNVIVVNIVSFALALLVTKGLKFQNIYRVGFFVPNLIGGLILGYVWQFIYNNAIPKLLGSVAIPFLVNNTFLAKAGTSIVALIFTGVWQYAGYIMMIYVTAIQAIPKELVEAAEIDGAKSSQRLRNIIIPMVMQAFTITLFLTLVNSFKQFDVNYALTSGGPAVTFMGTPINGTMLLAYQIYNTGSVVENLGLAEAQSIVFFIVLSVVSLAQVYITKKREVEL